MAPPPVALQNWKKVVPYQYYLQVPQVNLMSRQDWQHTVLNECSALYLQFLKIQILIHEVWGVSERFCISNKLLLSADHILSTIGEIENTPNTLFPSDFAYTITPLWIPHCMHPLSHSFQICPRSNGQ